MASRADSCRGCTVADGAISGYQRLPGTAPGSRAGYTGNTDLVLDDLRSRLSKVDGDVYGYVIASVRFDGDCLKQAGCGPNFEGGLITLCTCKHWMRASGTTEDWEGRWVAGFTSVNVTDPRGNYLVYLMRVGKAFRSHRDLWESEELPQRARQAKRTDRHTRGDVYVPKNTPGDEFDWQSYEEPCSGHVHCHKNEWRKDVTTRAALLLGERKKSFLWNRPLLRLAWQDPIGLGRGHRRLAMSELLSRLEEGCES